MGLLTIKQVIAIPLLLIYSIMGETKENVIIEKFRPIDPWIVRQISKDVNKKSVGKRLYVMYLDDLAVGLIRFGVIKGNGVISRISVHPQHHNKGYDKLLENFARNEFKKERVKQIKLPPTQKKITFKQG